MKKEMMLFLTISLSLWEHGTSQTEGPCAEGVLIDNVCFYLSKTTKSPSSSFVTPRDKIAVIRDAQTYQYVVNRLKQLRAPDIFLDLEEDEPEQTWRWAVDRSVIAGQGCFADNGTTADLPFQVTVNDLTPEKCIKACKDQGYFYAGLQVGKKCFCGDRYGKYGTATPCRRTCPVTTSSLSRFCGGIGMNFVYDVNGIMHGSWAINQPNYHEHYQYCAVIDVWNGYQYADERCGLRLEFICEITRARDQCGGAGYSKDGSVCLYLGTTPADWWTARQTCTQLGGDFIKIADAAMHQRAASLIQKYGKMKKFWIGLHRLREKSGFTWKDGNAMTYNNWASTAPRKRSWKCVIMSAGHNYEWLDVDCDAQYHYLVTEEDRDETPPSSTPYNGVIIDNTCYYVSDKSGSRLSVTRLCAEKEGGTRVEINEERIQLQLETMLSEMGAPSVWLNLFERSEHHWWHWEDKSQFVAQGCYQDDPDYRDLRTQLPVHNLTVENCISACADKGFNFAGVQGGNECYCGNRLGGIGKATGCITPCLGGPTPLSLYCGGYLKNSVFSTTGTQYGSWAKNQPNNYMGYQRCAVLDTYRHNKYADESCLKTFRYICQINSGEQANSCSDFWFYKKDSVCLYMGPTIENYYSASYLCAEQGGSLVKIHNQSMTDHVLELIDTYGYGLKYWIGLKRIHDRAWVWGNGSWLGFTAMRYSKFASNDDAFFNRYDTCAFMNPSLGYLWDDANCDQNLRHLCATNITTTEDATTCAIPRIASDRQPDQSRVPTRITYSDADPNLNLFANVESNPNSLHSKAYSDKKSPDRQGKQGAETSPDDPTYQHKLFGSVVSGAALTMIGIIAVGIMVYRRRARQRVVKEVICMSNEPSMVE